MTTAWSHLPNVHHIDRILADVRANPGNWAYSAVSSAARDAARSAARSAILALIAWPESADYLNLSEDSVRVLAALGDHKAVLILPAAIAFDQQKEIT